MSILNTPIQLGEISLKNRVLMAPLTRMRSTGEGIPNELNVAYYTQRASAGLIISEATQISPQGQGYPATPGIYSDEQVAGWQRVTHSVHDAGGQMVLQLWHVGRISHSSYQLNGAPPVAPSAIQPSGKVYTKTWQQVPYETPMALDQEGIRGILSDYQRACQNAKAAGFDGVEVHGANGYLLDQFLQDGTNQRTDEYGGSIENRARLLLAVVDIAIAQWGAGRVGVRLSPYGTFNDIHDSDPVALFTYVLGELNRRGIAYVHMIEPRATSAGGSDAIDPNAPSTSALFRPHLTIPLVSAGGYTPDTAITTVASGGADAIAFGRLFIANPDLPARIEEGAALNPYDRRTFYGGSEKGYTDYPFLVTVA
ncbi:alkene reductase [bacterium]|nr:alkene reductase [bacterium]